jgi:glycosyltransferase involved in cell wall biosynthesis
MPLSITVYVHMYPPIHCAGSEVTVHAALRALAARGHDVKVIADRTPESYEYEGVKVFALPKTQFHHSTVREIAADADILMTHLDNTSLAMGLHVDLQKPLVHWIHNHAQLGYWNVPPFKAQLVVFNTHWIAANEKWKGQPWPGRSIVIHPVIEPEKYRCKPGTKITFCNPTEGKGVYTVHKIAEAMPDYEFLIVEGIYGEQVAPPHLNEEWEARHPNIEHMRNTPDFREVLRKTKVLLMPSNYESFGRCAVEATCAGIPVVVHPTQGLWEALGDGRPYPATDTMYGVEGVKVIARETMPEGIFDDGLVNGAGIFCQRLIDYPKEADAGGRAKIDIENDKRLAVWKAQIQRLYHDEVYYRSRSDAALKLADTFDPESDFDRLEEALMLTTQDWNKQNEVITVPMWTSDRRIWETTDGLVAEVDGRIPANALRLAVGIGGQLPEEVAIANGFIPPKDGGKAAKSIGELAESVEKFDAAVGKAVSGPAENKAIAAPAATKAKGKKKKAA